MVWGTSVNGPVNSLVENGLMDANIQKGVEDRLDDETEHNAWKLETSLVAGFFNSNTTVHASFWCHFKL